MRMRAVVAAAFLCAVQLGPSPALAHGGGAMAGAFPRGGYFFSRATAVRPFRMRHALRGHRLRHAPGGTGAGAAVFGPLYVPADEPPGYGERFNEPRPPVWRECFSQTRMVPSSAHPGFTPVAVTRCWRRY